MVEWRTCTYCWDWIWPAEQVYTDEQGRSPVCAVCHTKSIFTPAAARLAEEGDTPDA